MEKVYWNHGTGGRLHYRIDRYSVYRIWGRSWVSNWLLGIQNGGTSYATPFQFAAHWKALTLLTINPMLSPKVHLLDPGLVAFVTDLSRSNPIHVQLVGILILLLALIGFIKGIREREVWTLAPYILFAFLLHIVVGFGLAVFQYDMYLYAGHYLFAFPAWWRVGDWSSSRDRQK